MFLLISLAILLTQPVTVTRSCSDLPFVPESGVLFKLHQANGTWENLSHGLPEKINPISFWAENGRYFIGASEGLFTTNGLSPVQQWQKAMILKKDILGIFPGKHGPYAVALWNGFFQHDSALDLWRPMDENLQEKTVYSLTETSDGKLFAGGETGIYYSSDRGTSWQHVFTKGQVSNFVWTDGSLITCHGQSLWRSTDDGQNWERILHQASRAAQIKKTSMGLVAIFDGQEFAGVRTPNGIFLSRDNGATWMPYSIGTSAGLNDIYDIETLDDNFYVTAQGGIFHSPDRGKTWNAIIKMPADSGGFFKMIVSEGILYALMVKGC